MKHSLRYDIIRVLQDNPGTIADIRSRILLLRMTEQRAGPLRGPMFTIPFVGIGIGIFWPLPDRRIKKILLQLEREDKVLLLASNFTLTERGRESHKWIMRNLNTAPAA